MRRIFARLSIAVAVAAALTSCANTTKPGMVNINRPQLMLIPAETIEKLALNSYAQEAKKASDAGRLVKSGPLHERVVRVATRIRNQVGIYRDDAKNWKWNLVIIDSPTVNASCAPGGKITVYTGIIEKLNLTDDELAMILGHEVAHALREHGRERVSQALAADTATRAALANSNNPQIHGLLASQMAKYLLLMPHSRDNESEADKMGLELATRAGYDPRASVTLWRKMQALDGGKAPPEFLSTHPSNERRVADLQAMVPAFMPLYHPPEAASAPVKPSSPTPQVQNTSQQRPRLIDHN